jgi:hypothetical protein
MGISPKMKARLESIDRLVLDGYRVKKIYNAWPELATLSGVPKNITISNPAGFSWIAFFFPFAVYAQIKEWSYFYVAGFVSLGGSVLNKIVGWDPSMLLGLALGLQYGIFFSIFALDSATGESNRAGCWAFDRCRTAHECYVHNSINRT